MMERTQEILKKFERDYEVYVDATDAQTYWIVYARIPNRHEAGLHSLHQGKKYVSGPNQEGSVLIMPDPAISDAYLVESWGPMPTFDDFVKNALASILAEKTAADAGDVTGCGTSCN